MLKASSRTGLVFFPAFDWAIDPTHPEREERLLYTQDQVFEEGLFDIEGIVEFKPDLVNIRDVQRVHFCVPDPWRVMTESHFISAGGAKTIGMAVLEGAVEKGFALVRPPGHHAMRVVHGARGFCNVNIEAIMIEYLRRAYGVRKVAVVDTDCHHGDGTQDIYWHDPYTLFISIHQDGRTLYPGSGFPNELGGPNALGTTINIPLPPNTGEEGILYAVRNVVMPILEEFKPDLVVNSAGQDNHFSDPITNMNFTARGYAELTRILKADIAVLEGGYSIESALPYVNVGIILAMAGLDYSRVVEPGYTPDQSRQRKDVSRVIERTAENILSFWNQRSSFREQMRDKLGSLIERRRNIFYDTDNIHEHQTETVRVCEDCGGALKIDTRADGSCHVLGVHVPVFACPACIDQGREWYETADDLYENVYLQDRATDAFTERRKL